jgi:hypothetical protein
MLLAAEDPADRAVLLLLNGGGRGRAFALPSEHGRGWDVELTSAPGVLPAGAVTQATLPPHSFMLLRPAGGPVPAGDTIGE